MNISKRFPTRFVSRHPIISFFVLLALLLMVIIVGDRLRAPEMQEDQGASVAKSVEVFSLEETPRFIASAVVEDEGVITVSSQISAIVSRANISAGDKITRGKTLVNLSDTYLGGSSASIASSISQRNAQAQNEIAKRQLDINERNGDEAPKTDDDMAKNLRADLKIQEQNTLLSKDTAELQAEQARINVASYFPSSPLTGTVERVHVAPGELVSPGTPLVTVSGTGELTATVLIPQRIASSIDTEAEHYALVDGKQFAVTPKYLSRVSTNDQNYSLTFSLPESLRDLVTDQGFLSVSIALENAEDEDFTPLIPVDAVSMTTDKSFVFVVHDGMARSKTITTGEVLGKYVEVLTGLERNDTIIVNRGVLEGDLVEIR